MLFTRGRRELLAHHGGVVGMQVDLDVARASGSSADRVRG